MKFFLSSFFFFTFLSYAQLVQKKGGGRLPVLKMGYAHQKKNFAELGVSFWKQKGANGFKGNTAKNPWIIYGPAFGSDISLDFKNFTLGPKVGYEFYYTPLLLGSRVNIVNYTNFKRSDWRITPEAGLTIIGVINIFYGYSFALNKNEFETTGNHRISIFLNIPTFLSGHGGAGGKRSAGKNRARVS